MKFIDKIKLKTKIRQVEKRVLHYNLHKWQKDVILNGFWDNPNVPWYKRASGKTTAYDLYFILNYDFKPSGRCINKMRMEGYSLETIKNVVNLRNLVLDDEPQVQDSRQYRHLHIRRMMLLYQGMKDKGIKVREIKFYDK